MSVSFFGIPLLYSGIGGVLLPLAVVVGKKVLNHIHDTRESSRNPSYNSKRNAPSASLMGVGAAELYDGLKSILLLTPVAFLGGILGYLYGMNCVK